MSKTKILICDGFAKDGINILEKTGSFDITFRKETSTSEVSQLLPQYDCVIVRSATKITRDLIDQAAGLKLIVRAGAGVDNIDVVAATEKKIPVMNTATANSLAAAEQTIALMFSMLRSIPQASASLASGKWDRESFKGYEATGKTIGVIGLGNIGRIVAEKALGLGMHVAGFDPMIQNASALPATLSAHPHFKLYTRVEEVAAASNLLTVHVPKNKATTNLVNAALIAQMKDKSFVINCARGGIVNEADVIAAVDSGKLVSAAFDVFEKEPPEFPKTLFNHPKIICTPHLGASTVEAQDRVGTTAAQQIIGFFSKGDRTGIIN